jgi:hypothetical protein
VRRAAAVAATLVLLAGCGANAETSPAEVQAALEARLVSKHLSYEWVYCLRTRRSFEDRTIFRCNVNYGEPHIVIYCVTLEGESLETNREQPGIRCGRKTGP